MVSWHMARDLSAKVRKNERLWETVDVDCMLGPTFGFKYSQEFQIEE